MGKINQLDISIANLIAAGEVVERPASVVKELLENSIDAGATDITVEIKNGGISFIRIADNGCGMSEEDACLCLSRHATSKISSKSDLVGITTLGFRGEALAAISSVSKVRIMTREKSAPLGTVVTADYGKIIDVSESGCKKGTTIIVEELFSNVPVRRNFLKNDRSEALAVSAVVEKIALSSPDVAIKYIQDNQVKLMTAGDGNLYNTVYSIYGKQFTKELIAVDYMTSGISVRGFIGKPENVRSNRNFQIFFINMRYFKSRTVSAALEQGFSSYLESEKFPVAILFTDIHPAHVDVNVHPTKLEVRFSNERLVFDAVYCAVKNALMNHHEATGELYERRSMPDGTYNTYNSFTPVYDNIDPPKKPEQITVEEGSELPPKKGIDTVPFDDVSVIEPSNTEGDSLPIEEPKPSGDNLQGKIPNEPITESMPLESRYVPPEKENEEITPEVHPEAVSSNISEETKEEIMAESAEDLPRDRITVNYKYLGTVFNTYIVIEYDKKMLMIDKHAAHERIIFEQMKKNRESAGKAYKQMLLIPKRLSVSKAEIAAAEDYKTEITDLGFEYETDLFAACISISAYPGALEQEGAEALLLEILYRLSEGTGSPGVSRNAVFERSLYSASCKAAVKGGRLDGEEHMRYIVEALLQNPEIRYCPHGRPVIFELTQSAIEHKFKRS